MNPITKGGIIQDLNKISFYLFTQDLKANPIF